MPHNDADILVLKMGSSVLPDRAAYARAAEAVRAELEQVDRLVVVVSAVGTTTDDLIAEARKLAGGDPDPLALATLLCTGEIASAARLAFSLQRIGVAARALDVHQIGFAGQGAVADAAPTGLDTASVLGHLERTPVIIVPGFIVVGDEQELLLTGRGGSDVSAIFIAAQLGARAILVKDVDGVYDRDPNAFGAEARRYTTLSWRDAEDRAGIIVQSKAVRTAQQLELSFRVTNLAQIGRRDPGTLIGAVETGFDDAPVPSAAAQDRLSL